MCSQKIQQKKDNAPQVGTAFIDAGSAFNDNAPAKPASGKRLLSGLSWALVVLSGAVTCVWLAAVGWMVVKLFRWLVE